MCSAERRVQQLRRLQHQRVDVDFNGLQRLLAGKGEEMLGQVGAAFGGFVDQLGDGRELGLIGDGFFQDADRTRDHGQDIVEVMRDATRELADRVHLLRMPQLGFRGLLFGQIPADEEMASNRLRPRSGPVQCDRLALLVDIARLEIALALSPSRRPHLPAGMLEIVGVDEFHCGMSDHVGGLIAEDRGDARADLDEITRGVGHEDEIVRGIEDAPSFLDFLAERTLRPLVFGGVVRGFGDADDFAGGRADRGDAQRDIDGAAILAHT